VWMSLEADQEERKQLETDRLRCTMRELVHEEALLG